MPKLHTDPSRVRRGAAQGPFLLALFGFLLALATAAYVVYRDPPWGRLSKYDFSTPEAALRSQIRMTMNADSQARSEYQAKMERKRLREKMDTLEIKRSEEFEKKKALFIAFKKEGKEVRAVEWYERDEDTGLWKQTYVNTHTIHDKKLASEIESWPTRDGFGGLGGFDN